MAESSLMCLKKSTWLMSQRLSVVPVLEALKSVVNAVHSTSSSDGRRKLLVGEYNMIGKKAEMLNPIMCFGHLIQGHPNWKE